MEKSTRDHKASPLWKCIAATANTVCFKRPETSLLDCWLFSKYPGVASVLELALSKPLPNVSQILAFSMALTQ